MAKKTTKKPEPVKLNPYMMWVGAEHYPTIADWTAEAAKLGVSKRLPNAAMATALMEPNTVVFVAHDEGEWLDCEECLGTIECGECRKRQVEIFKLETRLEAPDTKPAVAARLRAKADKLIDDKASCEECMGVGSHTHGTGGTVRFENGKTMDYRQYNYWLHQPKAWTADKEGGIAESSPCVSCGGKGKLPNGVVFGMFIPSGVEMIVSSDVEAETAKALGLAPVGMDVVERETKRGCGKRKHGGVYVVTTPVGDAAKVAETTKALDVATDLDIKGNFVQFLSPISISGTKRFRGLARIDLDMLTEGAEMEDAAVMAKEATE